MILPVDDINPGKYITISGPKLNLRGKPYMDTTQYEGLVLKVIGKSLPFLAVDFNGKTICIDSRKFTFAKCEANYVRAMLGNKKTKKLKNGGSGNERSE